jgi:hypothetical protein
VSEFLESVDDMIGRHFAPDATSELKRTLTNDPGNWAAAEQVLHQLIRTSIAHARNQVERRRPGTMTFEEAMAKTRIGNAMVTRPAWNIFRALRLDDDQLLDFTLDNCDGDPSGLGKPYKPTDDDRAARDWMLYQAPAENWIELHF